MGIGSLNFGTKKNLDNQIKHLYSITKKNDIIYWRQNPGLSDHPWQGVEEIQFFPWSKEWNIHYCKRHRFELKELKQDTGNRLYAEWIRQ